MRVYVNVHNINRHMNLLLNLLSSFLVLRVFLLSTWIIDMTVFSNWHWYNLQFLDYNTSHNDMSATQWLFSNASQWELSPISINTNSITNVNSITNLFCFDFFYSENCCDRMPRNVFVLNKISSPISLWFEHRLQISTLTQGPAVLNMSQK